MEFQTKERIISEYLSNVDFVGGDWSYKKIQEDLRNLIGEAPAVNVNYKKDVSLNELNSEATEVTVIDTIDVVFSPDLDNKFKKLTFKVGRIDS